MSLNPRSPTSCGLFVRPCAASWNVFLVNDQYKVHFCLIRGMHRIDEQEIFLNGNQHEDLMFGPKAQKMTRTPLNYFLIYIWYYILRNNRNDSFQKIYNNESVNNISKIM